MKEIHSFLTSNIARDCQVELAAYECRAGPFLLYRLGFRVSQAEVRRCESVMQLFRTVVHIVKSIVMGSYRSRTVHWHNEKYHSCSQSCFVAYEVGQAVRRTVDLENWQMQ